MIQALLLLAFFQPPGDIPSRVAPLLGGLPELRAPLNARVTGSFDRPGYRVEKVVFESIPGFRVTGNLYLPSGRQGPFPAVLGVAGHSDNGKASATYQAAWISLVRRGYVVLAYDPPGQGERLEYFDSELGLSRTGPGVNEHIMAGLQCLLTGAPIARYFIWDGIRAVDYLLTRPEVDPKRIAIAGNSGGGTQAALVAMFDPRLAAAVSSCYITRWRELLDGPGPQDAEQIIPGFLSSGFDFIDYIRAFAPRPFLITSATRDFFPIAGARATYAEARKFYESIDAPGRVQFFEFDDTHGWSMPRRIAMYQFLDHHLRGVDTPPIEDPLITEPDSLLNVTPTGQLVNSFGTESVFTLNAALTRQVYPRRRILAAGTPDAARALIRERLGLKAQAAPPRPATPHSGRGGLVVSGITAEDEAELQRAGFILRRVDAPRYEAGRGGYTGAYQAAARQWLEGGSLLRPRVEALLAAYSELVVNPNVDPANIGVWGKGPAGVAAMLAAALEPGIAKVLVEGSITSWFAVTQSHLHDAMAELVIPGVLQDFDLPDLAPLIAPRPLLLADPRTPTGARIAPMVLRSEYPPQVAEAVERPELWPATRIFEPWLVWRPAATPR